MSESAVEKMLKEWRELQDPEIPYSVLADEVEKAIAADKAAGLLWSHTGRKLVEEAMKLSELRDKLEYAIDRYGDLGVRILLPECSLYIREVIVHEDEAFICGGEKCSTLK